MADFIEQKGKGRNIMLAVIGVVTLALIIGMMLFMRDDTAAVPERPVERRQLFKESPPSGLNQISRSESASGGGLDMFSATNAGFYGENKATAAAAEQTEPAAAKSAKSAAVKAAPVKAKPKGAAIPRLKPTSFDKITPTDVSPGGAGQGMPDLSNMLKQAQQQGK